MKKILCGVILASALFFCIGCAQDADVETLEKSESLEEVITEIVDDKTEESTEIVEEVWGTREHISMTDKEGDIGSFSISLPYYNTVRKGGSHVAQQSDGTLVIIGTESIIDEAIPDSLEEVVEFYKFQNIKGIKSFRNLYYDDFDFTIETTEMIEVNGYEICKHHGVHTFTFKGDPYEMNFVSYATKIKANDGYIYWLVIDETEAQDLTELLESHCENMAKSIVEDTY